VTGRRVAMIGAVLIAVGSVLPWATASNVFGASVSISGTEGDGIITLVLGILVAVGALVRQKEPGSRAWLSALFSLLALGISGYDYTQIVISSAFASNDYVDASAGIGIYLVIIGGFLGLLALSPNPHEPEVEQTKICPQCAETVKAAANVCRFCGHQFVEARAA